MLGNVMHRTRTVPYPALDQRTQSQCRVTLQPGPVIAHCTAVVCTRLAKSNSRHRSFVTVPTRRCTRPVMHPLSLIITIGESHTAGSTPVQNGGSQLVNHGTRVLNRSPETGPVPVPGPLLVSLVHHKVVRANRHVEASPDVADQN